MSANDKYDRPHAVSGRTSAVNPQDTMPQSRIKTPETNMRPGPGRTEGITTKGDGKSSFARAEGFRGKTAATRNRGPGRTGGITKTSDGKTSFERV